MGTCENSRDGEQKGKRDGQAGTQPVQILECIAASVDIDLSTTRTDVLLENDRVQRRMEMLRYSNALLHMLSAMRARHALFLRTRKNGNLTFCSLFALSCICLLASSTCPMTSRSYLMHSASQCALLTQHVRLRERLQ